MNKTMVISKAIYTYKVIGYDDTGEVWSFKFFKTKEDALKSTADLLKDYNRENYIVIDETVNESILK